jgi:hypothetical protein
MPRKKSTFIFVSAHNASAMASIIPHSENCGNIKTLLHLEQQLTLYMYKCLSHVLRNLQNGGAVYISTRNKLSLILGFLCTTVNNVTLLSMAMQQIGNELDTGKKFTENRVSSG